MKSLLVSLIVGFVASVSVAASTPEATTVARLLVNNPQVVAQLKKNNSTHLEDMKAEQVKQGVVKYTLTFIRSCHCMPSTATVTIVEDMTPTYRDGSPEYVAKVVILAAN